jgi:hypothetical protein
LSVNHASSKAVSNTTSVGGSKELLWKPRIVPPSALYGRFARFTEESRRRLSFRVVPHGGHWSAPRVIAALAGLVHDRQSAADYEYNHDKNNQ